MISPFIANNSFIHTHKISNCPVLFHMNFVITFKNGNRGTVTGTTHELFILINVLIPTSV
jgi:hypothetical protein